MNADPEPPASAGGRLRFTILGCGSSGGVPRLGGPDGAGHWGACDPRNPKNRRRRCALLVERFGPEGDGVTRVLIDAGPDLREQLLSARVSTLVGVLITHDHADHTHGLDDLRLVYFHTRERLKIWSDARTGAILEKRFDYAFRTPDGSIYPPILDLREITEAMIADGGPVVVTGAGGPITARPFPVEHGRIRSLGFRIGGLAYLPDVSAMTPAAWAQVRDLDVWVLDALRYEPHSTHANLETALTWIAEARPRRAVLTNMHVDLDYDRLEAETPPEVTPAYDGFALELPDPPSPSDSPTS